MGFSDWVKSKSYQKSKSNILDSLPPIVLAVRADIEYAVENMGQLENMDKAMKHWRNRKIVVAEAQKKLYENVAIWSSIPPEKAFNDIILPALASERLIKLSDPCFGPVVVAVFRACDAASKQTGVSLSSQTLPEIRQLVDKAGDLYM